MLLSSTIPTEGRIRRSRWQPIPWICGVMSCICGATACFVWAGTPLLKMIAPYARAWPELLQVIVLFGVMLSTMAVGWLIVRLVLSKIPWIERHF